MSTLQDYTSQTIQLKPDYEGEVTATLIRSNHNIGKRKSVLYVHGFIDYFFHPHLGDRFEANEFDFYALDLRKYGRSLQDHQHPNYCKDLQEYFEEITIAIQQIKEASNGEIYLLGHSTGGLIASNYMNYGAEKGTIKALILNSPFLDFNLPNYQKVIAYRIAQLMTRIRPFSHLKGVLSPVYAQSLHTDYHGEWDFNLNWKPIKGFDTYFAWFLAIRAGHKNMLKSNIEVPTLVMHSKSSAKMSVFSAKAMHNDTVLNVEDIKRVGVLLGKNVTLLEIENAQHDIFLSQKKVREKAMDDLFSWLKGVE